MHCECGCGQATTIADHTDRKYGYVKGQHKRFAKGHKGTAPRTPQEAWDRLIAPKLVKRGDCLCYEGGTHDGRGYGSVVIGNKASGARRVKTHRIAHMLFNGPVDGLAVMHICDNPPCCNPAHLKTGTIADNQRDMAAKGRSGKAGAILTPDQVRTIRAERALGTKLRALADRFGVGVMAISQAANRRNWKDVV